MAADPNNWWANCRFIDEWADYGHLPLPFRVMGLPLAPQRRSQVDALQLTEQLPRQVTWQTALLLQEMLPLSPRMTVQVAPSQP